MKPIEIVVSDSLATRFWGKVSSPTIDKLLDECWEWTSNKSKGYGNIWGNPSNYKAHRVAYTLVRGKLKPDLVLDHLCRNTGCVNPYHLEQVTSKENYLRGVGEPAKNARKTHCKRGHEFTPDNTYETNDCRKCKTCSLAWSKARWHGTAILDQLKEGKS